MPHDSAEILAYNSLYLKLHSLHIYDSLIDDPVVNAFSLLLKQFRTEALNAEKILMHGSQFLNQLFKFSQGLSWSDYIIYKIISHVNAFSLYFSKSKDTDAYALWLIEATALDLKQLQKISHFSFEALTEVIRQLAIADDKSWILERLQDMPTWPRRLEETQIKTVLGRTEASLKIFYLFSDTKDEPDGWQQLARALSYYHRTNACGVFTVNRVFKCDAKSNERLLPVQETKQMQDYSLYDYTHTLSKLSENTMRFLKGKIAENALLYGPRGTGKSSSVRLMLKRYSDQGLRLIELRREDLKYLAEIFDLIHDLSIRFIIFIDDLSFDTMNDEYTMFKNVLEGSVLKQPENVLIYVTSNRRHLVSENFLDTQNALYENDVRSERLSLAERFGLRLRFVTPQKKEYLALILHALNERGISLSTEEEKALEEAALADSANEASMSPRNAIRFVRNYIAKGEKNVH